MPIILEELHICDVCRLLDKDTTPKECGFCGLCDSWICKADSNRWDRRARAYFKRKMEPNYKGMKDYEKVAF